MELSRFLPLALVPALLCPLMGAAPQSTPMPSPQATAAASPQSSGAPGTAAPGTAAPSAAPVHTMAPRPSSNGNGNGNASKSNGKSKYYKYVKKLQASSSGSLSDSQVLYAVSHQSVMIAKLKSLKHVDFKNVRIYRVSSALRAKMKSHTGYLEQLAYAPFALPDAVAQTSSPLLNLLANITIDNALNNTLNGNTVNLTLADVLNANNIAVGQVLGVYVGSGGIITTII